MLSRITQIYTSLVFGRPIWVLLILLTVASVFAYHARNFRLDASADSLLLEGDKDLEYTRFINTRYGIRESVIVAYTPLNGDLFARETLQHMQSLQEQLLTVDRVQSIDSILNVPIFEDTPLVGISENYLTLMDAELDLVAAREELISSPIFRNALISPDGETAGMLVNFEIDERSRSLIRRRTELRNKEVDATIAAAEVIELRRVEAEYAEYSVFTGTRLNQTIARIRGISDNDRNVAQRSPGGGPRIADDLVTFVRSDLRTFGFGVVAFIIVALGLIFRKVRWVVLPLACCAVAGTIMVGILGLMDWRVTVVSSNFISLLMIITISLTLHLIVRYRELRAKRHYSNHDKLLKHAVLSMFKPCVYTALTTAVAFGTLIVSGISPIISFGWMMVMGMLASLIVVFVMFPAVMSLLPIDPTKLSPDLKLHLTSALARLTDTLKNKVLYIYAGVLIFSVLGLTRLEVENSFIDYFREKTEIFQGMTLFDKQLGGTLSFDLVVDLPVVEDDFDDGFDDSFGGSADADAYWFTAPKMDLIKSIHTYLDDDPQTGKVLSFGAVIQLAEKLNAYEPIDGVLWAILYNRIPETLKESVLYPFVSIEENQLRFNVRVIESDPDLQRNELLQRIERGVEEEFGFADEAVTVTGILVLYNNVLQRLFDSQILTLGVVMLVITLMFLVLFRSLKIALICIIPNAIAAIFVLGLMGWLGIPLDIMTITIAAISIGIGVVDTIHYMHRFNREFSPFGHYRKPIFSFHA